MESGEKVITYIEQNDLQNYKGVVYPSDQLFMVSEHWNWTHSDFEVTELVKTFSTPRSTYYLVIEKKENLFRYIR